MPKQTEQRELNKITKLSSALQKQASRSSKQPEALSGPAHRQQREKKLNCMRGNFGRSLDFTRKSLLLEPKSHTTIARADTSEFTLYPRLGLFFLSVYPAKIILPSTRKFFRREQIPMIFVIQDILVRKVSALQNLCQTVNVENFLLEKV